MNQNRHRVVFNAARGIRMVVGESARSIGKATGVAVTTGLMGLLVLTVAQAQIVADPKAPGNQRPTILTAPNGVPLVNIQTPSAGGVSRNTYSQFDVNGQGAILNNSRTANSISTSVSFNGKPIGKIELADGPGAYLGKQLIEQTSRALTTAALQGTDLEDAIVGALVSSALTTATAYGANEIGNLTVPDANGIATLTPAGQKLAHALLGCASGAVQTGSQGCAAGAAGAVLGHLAAEWMGGEGGEGQGKPSNAQIEAFSALIGGLGGALVAMHTDGDAQSVTIGSVAGQNAAANNYLRHVEAQRLAELKHQQLKGQCGSECERDIQRLETLDRERNRTLAACEGSNSAQCQAVRQDLRIAAAEYIRVIDPSLDLRTLQERDETISLAHNSMGGVATRDVVDGYLATLREGVESLVNGAKTAAQALMGDPQAQAALREGAGQMWAVVQDPEQWPYLLGAMTPQQREALALAYEQGDIRTIGRLMGEQTANLPSGGGVGSIKKVGALSSLPKGQSPVDIAHTIGGDYNVRTGKVTGGHTLLNGDVRVTQVVSAPDANGVYEAFVEIQLPDGTWQAKTVGSTGTPQKNTMFPNGWDAAKVQAEIESAWSKQRAHPDSNKWIGTSDSGIEIEGYKNPRTTAYPLYGAKTK